MNTRVPCCLCSEEIPLLRLLNHIPVCYRAACQEQGVVPHCTCDECKGVRAHSTVSPQTTATTISKKRPLLEVENEEIPLKKEKTETPASLSLNNHSTSPAPSTKSLEGKVCFACGKQKSPSACPIPTIHIGKYRQIKLCKKQHLEESTSTIVSEKIEGELQTIRTHGDTKQRVLLTGSDTETEDSQSL